MTSKLDKLYAIKNELARLIDREETPKRWKQFQDYCDSIADCFNGTERLTQNKKTINRRPKKEINRRSLTGEDACVYLGICYRTLKKLIDSGEIPCRNIGGRYFFVKENLDKWLEGKPAQG